MNNYKATKEDQDVRIDKIIQKNVIKNLSFSLLQKLFRTKKVKVNGVKVDSSYKVCDGDEIIIYSNVTAPTIVEKPDRNSIVFNKHDADVLLKAFKDMIIYENSEFLAINKPSGLAVQLGSHVSICVETYLKADKRYKYHLVHRLDKDTSGILLVAKNVVAARNISKLFQSGDIKKTYIAIVEGNIERSMGKIDTFMEKSMRMGEEKVRITCDESAQRAISKYKKIQDIKTSQECDYALLELYPLTGRKHQLRVHCAEALNAPIIGDKKYHKNGKKYKNMFLHAWKLEIPKFCVSICAPIPKIFDDFVRTAQDA